MTAAADLDMDKVQAFVGKVLGDWGGFLSATLVTVGDKVGLYRALADGAPVTPAELAERTGTSERYLREWLLNQAASGYVEYDSASGRYRLPPEHALALTDEASPLFLGGGFQVLGAMAKATPRIVEGFKTGRGMLWGEHDPDLFAGTERFFRPGYAANLVASWIPALDGVDARLRAGGKVADVGCGHGASTIIMAQAYPDSRFFGFDNHAPSIDAARRSAGAAGLGDRVTFAVASAQDFPGEGYDLITFFDCLHDMGDPTGAAKHARAALAPTGAAMIVEPMAGERVEDNFNPVGVIYSGASVLCCTPNALASGTHPDHALGTVASDAALRAVVTAGGFGSFRRATETPFNRVFEAKP